MRIVLILIFAILTGCAVPPKKPISPPTAQANQGVEQKWQHHQQRLSQLNHWQAQGRLAVSQNQKGGNASYVWQQKGDSYQIKLFGPFGSGAVYITGRPQHVELKEANGKVTTAQSPELLLKKVAGWNVPLTGLQYWLLGIPSPQGQQKTPALNHDGLVHVLQEQGWRVNYESYTTENAIPLPNKLLLQNGNLKIKMVVTSWQQLSSGPQHGL